MADETGRPGTDVEAYLASLSPAELARLQALANKRNQSLEMVAEAIRRQNEARAGIIDKMR